MHSENHEHGCCHICAPCRPRFTMQFLVILQPHERLVSDVTRAIFSVFYHAEHYGKRQFLASYDGRISHKTTSLISNKTVYI